MSTKWISTKQASEELGITIRTLYRLVNEGQVPAYKFGRVIRLQLEDVERFISASRIRPGTLSNLYPTPAAERNKEAVNE